MTFQDRVSKFFLLEGVTFLSVLFFLGFSPDIFRHPDPMKRNQCTQPLSDGKSFLKHHNLFVLNHKKHTDLF